MPAGQAFKFSFLWHNKKVLSLKFRAYSLLVGLLTNDLFSVGEDTNEELKGHVAT